VLYLVSPSNDMLRQMIRAGTFGAIITPATGYRVDGLPVWAADNACGPGPNGNAAGYPGDTKWQAWLQRMAPHADRCLFAAVPDVVGDAAATLDRFAQFAPAVKALGYPVALVAQDGLENLTIPWSEFQVLFIGGTTAWKMGFAVPPLIDQALARGLKVHVGRVNGGPRFAYFKALGAHTADGKCLNIAPDTNIGRHAKWQALPVQGVLL
jgi:hypothetical protein